MGVLFCGVAVDNGVAEFGVGATCDYSISVWLEAPHFYRRLRFAIEREVLALSQIVGMQVWLFAGGMAVEILSPWRFSPCFLTRCGERLQRTARSYWALPLGSVSGMLRAQ